MQTLNLEQSPTDVAPDWAAERLPRTGRAAAISHHGELLQGVFVDATDRLVRGLVTFPRLELVARARYVPRAGHDLVVKPAWKTKARRAAAAALTALGYAGWGGELQLTDAIPIGYGFGSSTSDVVAAIRAVSDAFGRRLRAREVARLAVDAEVASDSTMFEDRTVLFAQREGCVIEDLGPPSPGVEVLGFNLDLQGRGVSTLELEPARYSWREVQAFRPLLGLLRAAIRLNDIGFLCRVATTSARINQSHLPKPHFDRIEALMEGVGASGLQVAHSGTILGLMFEPRLPELEARIAEAEAKVRELGVHEIWRFRSGGI
jgi:uncharacterized protein involved in propanediol utilization